MLKWLTMVERASENKHFSKYPKNVKWSLPEDAKEHVKKMSQVSQEGPQHVFKMSGRHFKMSLRHVRGEKGARRVSEMS